APFIHEIASRSSADADRAGQARRNRKIATAASTTRINQPAPADRPWNTRSGRRPRWRALRAGARSVVGLDTATSSPSGLEGLGVLLTPGRTHRGGASVLAWVERGSAGHRDRVDRRHDLGAQR